MRQTIVILFPYILVIALFGSGCVSTLELSTKEQEESFKPFEKLKVEGEWLQNYVLFRSATVTDVHGSGSAIAIDSRGYFLTASHCLTGKKTFLTFAAGQKDRVEVREARVVWRGRFSASQKFQVDAPEDLSELGLDMALLHVDATLPHVFEWSEDLTKNEQVVGSGVTEKILTGEGSDTDYRVGVFGGEIARVMSKKHSEGDFFLIEHRSPILSGNSGGPLSNLKGELVGVNIGHRVIDHSQEVIALAVRPEETSWVDQLIAEDQKEIR